MILDPFDALEGEDGSPFEGDGPSSSNEEAAALQEAIDGTSRETLTAFMLAVVLAHVGLFAASLGLMLVGFRGQWWVGGPLVAVGLVALGLTVWVVRRHKRAE